MLGGRILAPYFGGSVYVWGSLIFTFMVGLSLGYGVGGRLSVRFYGIKILGALLCFSALQVLLVEFSSDWVLGIAFSQTSDPRSGSLLAALALYLLPTATLGTLSPVAIRTISHDIHKVGNSAGNLYLVSTLGSAVGTLVTAFWLVALFEVKSIMFGNAVALMLAASLCLLGNRRGEVK
ncbi:hypothetical protein MARGE09_P2785 [Marinagarivorans cellulosilyticus]|uniref:Glycosyl transferase n=2 Tax=Marinagarivorans cellulosilyticus TaxID=2721545 RepID=A0AAN2BL06_9GAMM|nr:hypothetical protein MARGE09_P2785 [Marinagarivorans cellulosilyticus]